RDGGRDTRCSTQIPRRHRPRDPRRSRPPGGMNVQPERSATRGTIVGLAGFARALAEAGLPAALDSDTAYLRALDEIDLTDPSQMYWAGRATLCRAPDDIVRYDAAFESWFGGILPTASRTRGTRT